MFGSKLSAAESRITNLVAMLALVGFDAGKPEASVEGFKAHLAAQESAESKTLSDLQASIQTANTEQAATLAINAAFTGAFASLGIAISGGPTADSVKSAIEAHIVAKATTQATNQVAASGHEALNLPAPGTDIAEVKSAKELNAEFDSITDSVKRAEFWAKNKAKMLS